MLYLIGLGLSVKGFSREAYDAVKKCKRVYLENYTVEMPYTVTELSDALHGKKIEAVDREFVESESIVDEAKKLDVALLVYGAPLSATTHVTLIQEAKKSGTRYRVIQGASIFDAISETGLQLYKFGKTASMPNFEADSFIDVVKDNQKIDAHSLILVDIGMSFQDALKKLEEVLDKENVRPGKIIVCSKLGMPEKDGRRIFYGDFKALREKGINTPFVFIIPGKLHFLEREFLEAI
jgi:diphthine synthase